LIRDFERLEELFRISDQFVKMLPRVFWLADDKLLYLLELVNPENAPCITTTRASFFPEARRIAAEAFR